jgi:CHAT domain-containing protein/predicted Zn-dependent protease
LYCLSQTNGGDVQILNQYRQANRYYNAALQYSNDDTKEAKLNQLALQEFTSLIKRLPANNPESDTIRFFSAVKIGELESYFDSSTIALRYYNEALGLQTKNVHLADSFFFKPYVFAGIIYYTQSKTDSAVNYFKKAEALQAKYKEQLQESERLYNMLGAVYYESGNFYQSKNYFSKATEVLPENHPFFNGLFVNYSINLATVLFKLEEYDTANRIFQKLLPYHIYQNEIYNNIGLINLYLGASKQAINYFKKVKYDNRLQVGLYNDIAAAYFNLKDYKLAKEYLDLAVEKNFLYYSNSQNTDLGRSFKLMGDIEKESGNNNKALVFYQQALHQLYPSFNDTSINSVPLKFSGAFSFVDLFNVLVAKGEVWHSLYQQTANLQYAGQELITYQSAFALLAYIERTYDSDQARLFLGKIKYTIHSQPVNIAFELYSKSGNKKYFDDLYIFDQGSKASVLAFNEEFSELAQQANSPLLQNVQKLKNEITRLSIQANKINDSLQKATIATTIRNLEIELGKKQEALAREIPLSENNIPPVDELQHKLLDSKTGLISYSLSDDKLTTIVITKDAFNCYQQVLPAGFHDRLQHYIGSLLSLSDSFSKKSSQTLYSFLLGNIKQDKIKHLIIIPDNELCYLPFETLIDEHDQYLIEKCTVQYQYSTSILKKELTQFKHHQTLAFAPFASTASESFGILPNSLSEIENLRGKKFLDTAATKINFLKHIQDQSVLHLATHAVVNSGQENFSYIMFAGRDSNEGRLYASEIYNLALHNTNLVILSACETGTGNLIKGEGVMSLSRAFSYAGCPNIITSLWKADDFSTAYLTNKIHKYLDEGSTIDEAIQKAKLDYLHDKKINPRLKQPYYWSHLVFVGNISGKGSISWIWFAIAIAVVLSIAAVIIIKKSSKKRTVSS